MLTLLQMVLAEDDLMVVHLAGVTVVVGEFLVLADLGVLTLNHHWILDYRYSTL